ncbi:MULTISPECIES: AAA family ATPase [unclassified Methylobacterium]|uniref:AAA family ATPase n=1 Tax=unclassified Methylobacterium TaxID=2615210 RepID=UPI0005B77463|nr:MULTISPECIES: AAA family ATPase [unclassified Methylobacterium]SFU96531.1 DNA repair exonuclease SbcCD ATPase subunit [Methylobacterium sp. UNCCL125]
MSGLRINRLRVDAFRGITGSVELDLRPALTVIYAANGTGKTTLCDATEWLLTGQVHRLCTGNAFDSALLVSKFAPGAEPTVEAEMELDGRPLYLRRDRSGARLGATRAQARPVQPGALLATLTAPARQDAGWEPHHVTAIRRRQQFLRATHILTAEELATLLDTDPETLGRRKEIFADLLDIREEHDSAGRLRRYADALLPDENALSQAVAEARKELAGATRALRRSGPRPSDEEAHLGERLLGMDAGSPGPRRVEALAAEIGRRRQAHAASMSAMAAVDEGWASRRTTGRELADGLAEEGRVSAALGMARIRASELAARARAASEAFHGVDRRRAESVGFRGAVAPRLPEMASAGAAAGLAPDATLATLRRLPEARMSAALRQERAAELAALARLAVGMPELDRRVAAADDRLSRLLASLPDEEEVRRRDGELAAASGGLEAARRRLAEIGQPLQRLRAEALAFLGHRHADADCPVCGHDWRTHERLRASVEAMLGGGPSLVAGLEREVANGERRVRQAGAAVAEATRLRGEVDALRRSLAQDAQVQAEFARRVRHVGPAATVTDLSGALSRLRRRVDAVEALQALEDELGARTPRFRSVLPDDTPLRAAAARFSAAMEAELASVSQERQGAQAAAMAAAEASRAAQARAEAARGELEALRGRLTHLRALQDGLARAWAVVAGDARLSVRARDEAREVIRHVDAVLTRAEAHLGAAKAARATEADRERVGQLGARLTRERNRLELIRGGRAAAARGADAFERHAAEAARQRVVQLSAVVNPLFARMHANRLIDCIEFGEGADFLRWCAGAGEATLDPTRDFSQGQRQDLALSLFIARARSLGGTFFLDEPVTHMDDLNRVGLLDVLRAVTLSGNGRLRLVVTTSSRLLARHLTEKFARVARDRDPPPMQVVEMHGNGRNGVAAAVTFPGRSASAGGIARTRET